MKRYYVEFIHSTFPNQQLCQEFFDAESLEKAKEYADSQEYVGLLLVLREVEQ